MYLGVDGANGGWLIAKYDGTYGFNYLSSFSEVWEKYYTRPKEGEELENILVDIPIGLRNDGEPRRCDTEARKRVRNGTVYPTPSRPALYEDTHEEAKRTNEEMTGGKSLSVQTWNIMPLIREVDDFLGETEEAGGLVREAHPDLCLWALNGGETVESKKQTQEGYEERLSVLKEVDETAGGAVVEGTEEYGDEVNRDDVVDALALAVTDNMS